METLKEITINYYDANGNKQTRCIVPVTSDALIHFELMQSHYCKLSFRLAKPVYISLGDFIETAFGRFEVIDTVKPKEDDSLGYSYEVQFDAYYRKFKNKTLKYRPNSGSPEASFSLTNNIYTHANVVLDNLGFLASKSKSYLYDPRYEGTGKTDYVVNVDASVDSKAAKVITYSNSSILDAIANIADTFDCEWWFEGNILHFGTCENTDAITDFKLGNNVASMSSSQSQSSYANRIYAFGAARNLPSGYKKDASADVTKDGVVERRLMLPTSSECSDDNKKLLEENGFELKDGCIQVKGITEDQYVEGVTTNDDIYPRNLVKTANVTYYEKEVEDESTTEEGDYITRTYYRLNNLTLVNEDGEKTGDMAFRSSYILSGKNLHIVFQSGSLNGMDFECEFNPDGKPEILRDDDGNPILKDGKEQINPEAQVFEVVANEDYGRFLPDTSLHPKNDDTFVLYNWDSTKLGDTLVSSASNELLTDSVKNLKKSMIDPTTYTCTMDSNYSFSEGKGKFHGAGDRVNLYNIGYDAAYRASRIIGYEIKLDIPFDSAKYYVGEKPSYSRLNAMESKIEELVYNGQSYLNGGGNGSGVYIIKSYDKTTPTEYNVYSAKAVNEQRLRKDKDDTAQGIITFLQGLKIGDTGNNEITSEGLARLYAYMTYGFNSGLYGEGASIDHKGNAELNSLFVRQFISTPKFVFNEISVTKAEQWNTNGGGTIESVDTETQQITLKLEENDYGSLSEGDICRGIFADIDNAYGSDSTIEGETDESGFVMHRGFFTTYFYVKRIIASEKGKFVFQYGKKSPSTPDPCAYMDFAQYGSFTDEKRQSSMYFSSRGNSYIEVLDGVNTWNVQSANRVARYGYLGGLSIKKKDGGYIYPEGNGIYVQDNVYFGGTLHSLGEIEGLKDKIQETAAYDVSLSQYQGVLTVDDMGNVIGGLYTEDEARTTKQYKVATAVFVRKGQEILLEEDDGNEDVTEGHYRVLAVSNECTVEIKNSTVFVTAIENIKDGVAGSSDDTDFDYDTMRKMSDCMVTVVVDLEGKTSKTVQMPIRIQHDSLPFMVCDLSNENASVMWNTKDKGYIGFPVETKVSLFYQNTPYKITDLNITVPAGLKASMSISGEAKVITIEADDLTTDSLPSVMKLPITVTGMYAGATYEYTKELTIMKSADTVIYEIIPSSDSIVADKDGNQTAGSVSCDVYATSSENNRYKLSELPSGFSLKYGYTDSSVSTSVGLGKAVGVTVENKQVIFALYDASGNVLDRESVPVLSFGKDGKGAEYIFKRTTDGTQPSNPTPTDYATNTAYQSSTTEYIPSGWTDDPTGVDAVNVYEWVCVRTSTNGHWGRFSDPAEYAHYGKHAPSAKTSDDIVTIPTDSKGGALLAFSETVTFDLLVDGRACTLSSVTVDKSTLSNVSCSLSSNKATISCSKGAALGSTAQTLVFKVTGTLDGATYTDYVTVKVVPNVTGEDGDGYEYIYYKSASASAPSTPKRSGGSLTSGWYDDPMSPTESYPYVYVAYRQGKIGEDGTFSAPALFAYKAQDGKDGQPSAKASILPEVIAIPVNTDGYTLVSGNMTVDTSLQAGTQTVNNPYLTKQSSTISSNISVTVSSYDTITISWSKGVSIGLAMMYLKLYVYDYFTVNGASTSLGDYATLTVAPTVQGNEGDDGVGISSITTYYLISSASSGVTTSTSGWSTATTKPTSSQPYLWSYTHTVYTNGGVYDTSPVVVGNYAKDGQSIKGDTGTRGPIPRTHTGIESGYHYMSGATGEDYVDLVYYNGAWYRCKTTHDSTSTTMVSSYWDKSATTGWTFMATDLLLAETGYIENLRVDDVYITSKGSGKGDTIFIANKNGLTCKSGTFENVTVSGKVTATSGTFGVWAINTTDTCIESGNTNGNAQHGVGWSDYWGGYGELNLHTEGGGNSTGIKYSAKSSYLTTLLQLTTSGSSGQTGVDITAASGTAIKIATGSSGTAINAASGSFKGLRLPVSSGSVTAGAYGSDFVTVESGQTVTLSTPGDANKGAVVIIMPTSSGDFKISGKIRVCGTKFSSKTVQVGAAIHFCVCDGNYWSIGYMPFDDY